MSEETLPAPFSENALDALCAAIVHRRSLGVARLKPDAVDPALIRRALEAADWAPSHGETEPWRFVVYTGESRRALGQAFADAYKAETPESDFRAETHAAQQERAFASPVWISLGVEPALRRDGSLKMSVEEETMAVSCAAQNLHLVAAAQGLAGMWLSKGVFRSPHVAEFAGLSPQGFLLGFFVLGYPAIEWPTGERRPLSEKVRWAEG